MVRIKRILINVSSDELGDVPENILDVTEEYSRLMFENGQLKNNIFMLGVSLWFQESEAEESFTELLFLGQCLQTENVKQSKCRSLWQP